MSLRVMVVMILLWTFLEGGKSKPVQSSSHMKPMGLGQDEVEQILNGDESSEFDDNFSLVSKTQDVDKGESASEMNNIFFNDGNANDLVRPFEEENYLVGSGGFTGANGESNCEDVIINKSEWTGNMGATMSIKLPEAITSYSITVELDIPVKTFVFWEADITPGTDNTFTVTSKSWFGGKAAGETLDLGFQLSFDGQNSPKFTSIIFNNNNICDGETGSSGATTMPGQSETSNSEATTQANGTPAGELCSDPHGLYPDPTDCGKYYQCAHGDPVSYSCAEAWLNLPAYKLNVGTTLDSCLSRSRLTAGGNDWTPGFQTQEEKG